MDKALVIVPHQDDETNLLGNIIDIIKEQYDLYVLYSSIDPIQKNAEIRKQEAYNACNVWDIPADHLIFLDYPDSPNKHGYHYYSDGDRRIVEDIKKWILNLEPSIIFATDFDYHSDHRMLSIALETTLGQILKERYNYNPIIFKGFCYETAYYSIADYKASKPQNSVTNMNLLSNPSYEWKKRISIPSTETPGVIWKRKAYKALKAHRSQYAILHARAIVNQDNVFWIRRADNKFNEAILYSNISDIEKIRDFKILDTDDLITKDPRRINYSKACCKFETGSWIKAKWNSSLKFDRLVFNGCVNASNIQIVDIDVLIDGGIIGKLKNLEPYGRDTVLIFSEITAAEIEIRFNSNVELSEVGMFSGDCKLPAFINSDCYKKNVGRYLDGFKGSLVDIVDIVGYKIIVIAAKIRRKLMKFKADR